MVIWWYSRGWLRVAKRGIERVTQTARLFSLPELISTLFSPWKRIVSYPGSSLGDKARAVLDNIVSRAVGFFTRMFVLFSAAVLIIVVGVVELLIIIIWPILPLVAVGAIIKSII